MLILARKLNEKILIGDDIVLVVLSVESNRVKLGIDAPADVTILREEIANTPKGENDRRLKSASKDDSADQQKTGT